MNVCRACRSIGRRNERIMGPTTERASSPRARSRLLGVAVGSALGAAAGCATLGGANYVSIEEEWQLGRELEADLAGRLDIVNDATLQRYVNDLGQRMVRQTTMANLPWRFHVVQDESINAFNVPGGLVYVHTGLLARSGSAAEFAGALAHEISHGLARHGTRRYSQAQEANLLASILLGTNPGAIAQIGAQIAAAGAFARFSREDEREADEMAVELMAATGYNPEGLARLLERLMQQGSSAGGFFSSHPNPAERVQNVRAFARNVSTAGLRMDESGFATVRARASQYR
jgi:predicted Zn-dependent protease